MDDLKWKRLLGQINDGVVVPVLGSQLLIDPITGGDLQARFAEMVGSRCGIENGAALCRAGLGLSGLVNHLIRDPQIRLQELYEMVNEVVDELTRDEASIPKPIQQLAEISSFRLLVTATPDGMLARCLRKRCSVQEIIHSPNLGVRSGVNDLPSDWQTRVGETYLLYLFGKCQRLPVFAIHEEDVLEYAHNMIARGSNVPMAFLGELQARNLLFVGCRFPDWLSRFFLRITNKDRLSRERSKREWLIEQLQPGESLTLFLASYSRDTEVLSQMEPGAFVEELNQRWRAEHGASPAASGASERNGPPPRTMFFVSYSRRTDLPRAEAVVNALQKLGVSKEEVWFDRDSIEPAQDYQQRILDGIQGCRYFMPLLSSSAGNREEAFVFREWRRANERFKDMNREFVVPMIVDQEYSPERYCVSQAPDWPVRVWKERLDFGHAPDGQPDARTIARLQILIRAARRKEAML